MQSGPFSKQYRLRTLDLRGHGASRESPRRFTIEAFAADVADALRRDGEPPAHVIGLSLGGCVGLALALAAPDRVRSLTLVNAFAQLRPAGIRGAMKISQRLALLCTAPMPTVARHVARGLFPRPDQREQYLAAVARLGSNPRWTYLAGMLALARFDVRARLADVRCPTLVVVADRDRTVPRSAGALLEREIPSARLEVIPDSRHATPYDQPEVFNRIVLDFLSRVP